jgi:MFS family permease
MTAFSPLRPPCPSPTCPSPRLAAATLLVSATLTVMAGATIAPCLPALRAHFADTPNIDLWVRLVLSLPALAIALSSPPIGLLIDRRGRVPVLQASLVLYALAGTSGLVVDSLWALLAGRLVLGVAVAGILTSSTALIADAYDGPRRARFLGLQGAFMGFGGVLFLSLGGILAEAGWRWPFAVYLLSLPVLPGAILGLHDGTPLARQPAAAIVADKVPWAPLARIYAVTFLAMVVFYLVPTQIPFLLQALSGSGASTAGLAIAAGALVSAAVSLLYGRVARRVGYPAIAAASLALLAAGFLVVGEAESTAGVVAGLAVCGLGTGLIMPNGAQWLITTVPASLRGRSLGALNSAIFLGQFVSPVMVHLFLSDDGPAHAFLVVAGGAAFAGAALALQAGVADGRRRRRRTANGGRRRDDGTEA